MASPTIEQRDQGAALPITTTFVPPAECTQGHLTMLQGPNFFVYQNEPVPAAGFTSRSCFPDQFINSYLASRAGNTLPAFSPLACPQNYYTVSSQDVGADVPYVVCCPANYGFAPPAAANAKRPGQGGTCYSNIISTTVTKYNDNGYSGLFFFSTGGQAYAHPFDGFAYDGQHVATSDPAPATSAAVAPPQPSSNTAPAPSRQSSVAAAPGGTSAVSASTAAAQNSNTIALSSSVQSSAAATSTLSSSVTPISTSGSVILYSTVPASVVTIYSPVSNGSSSAATQQAITRDSAQLTTPAIVGMVVGIILGTLLLAAAGLFFFMRHRRRLRNNSNEVGALPEKPALPDHPSNRAYGADEKKNFYHGNTSPLVTYHELSSPHEVAHMMAYGNGDNVMEAPVGELEAHSPDSLPVSTFSPSKTRDADTKAIQSP